MYIILWQFDVIPGCEAEFESLYGPGGDWVQLFRQFDGFIGTELLHDVHHRGRYLTLDRWRAAPDYEAFLEGRGEKYQEIDRRGEKLTRHETRIGAFEENRAR